MSVPSYPFSAVVGLDDLRLALVVNAVSPAVGGVLVRGEKGTAKSTIVRALAALLPPVPVVVGCRFSCAPDAPDGDCPDGPHAAAHATTRAARLVELPVGASEDRLVGSLDLERALGAGEAAYEPGLLAAAHRGVLYVDEVNLLHDHLVDLLLDAAALGTSYVEREGVSVRHAARFLLVGTMNPEEGELRPQLLDRFGLTVEVAATRDPAQRAEVVRRRLAFEADPAGFAAAWQADDVALAARIAAAQTVLPQVVLGDRALREVTTVCAAFDVDGLRADLVTARCAIALAAWAGRTEVTTEDVRTAARLALPHRRRRTPFEAPGLDEQLLDDALTDAGPEPEPEPEGPGPDGRPDGGPDSRPDGPRPDSSGAPSGAPSGDSSGAPSGEPSGEQPAADPVPTGALPLGLTTDRAGRQTGPAGLAAVSGRRSPAEGRTGRTTGARRPLPGERGPLHLAATVRAAAPHQQARGRVEGRLRLRPGDLREAVREGREGNLVVFCVDASGSMAARQRMGAVKGAVVGLLTEAYQKRDKVALVTFRGATASLDLPPTGSVDAAVQRLRHLPTGGRTPLGAGLLRVVELLRVERVRDPRRRPLVVVVTDGRHTSGDAPAAAAGLLAATGARCLVVDCEDGPVRLGLAGDLGALLGGTVRLGELTARSLTDVVKAA